MKKNIIMVLLFVLVLGGTLLARENTIVKVKVQTANVRSEPDASAPIVARVAAGTLLEVASKTGTWYEVTVNDQSGKEVTGYIRDSVVEVINENEEATEAEPRAAVRREVPIASASNEMSFGINFGIMTDDSFSFDPIMWTAGAELDFQFGDILMLSPEVTLVGYKFEFKQFILYPAAILNLTPGNFFIGGGVTKGFLIGSGASGSTDFALKLNAGAFSKNIKLTAYLITPFDNLFKSGMAVGATLGFRF
jgi:hypothetical protein